MELIRNETNDAIPTKLSTTVRSAGITAARAVRRRVNHAGPAARRTTDGAPDGRAGGEEDAARPQRYLSERPRFYLRNNNRRRGKCQNE